jgi:hypothetical protein
MAIEYCHVYANQNERHLSSEWNQAPQDNILDLFTIRNRVKTLSHYKAKAREILICAKNELTVESLSDNSRLWSASLVKILTLFREKIFSCNNQSVWDVEKILDENFDELDNNIAISSQSEKRKPGRPTKEKIYSTATNMKIEKIFYHLKIN